MNIPEFEEEHEGKKFEVILPRVKDPSRWLLKKKPGSLIFLHPETFPVFRKCPEGKFKLVLKTRKTKSNAATPVPKRRD